MPGNHLVGMSNNHGGLILSFLMCFGNKANTYLLKSALSTCIKGRSTSFFVQIFSTNQPTV